MNKYLFDEADVAEPKCVSHFYLTAISDAFIVLKATFNNIL
jgi:hypothetical protein